MITAITRQTIAAIVTTTAITTIIIVMIIIPIIIIVIVMIIVTVMIRRKKKKQRASTLRGLVLERLGLALFELFLSTTVDDINPALPIIWNIL